MASGYGRFNCFSGSLALMRQTVGLYLCLCHRITVCVINTEIKIKIGEERRKKNNKKQYDRWENNGKKEGLRWDIIGEIIGGGGVCRW